MKTLPVFAIERHRMTTDGEGVTTLVGAYGCPLQCRYCLNPHAWNPETLKKCTYMSAEQLYDRVKVDDLYFQATGGGVTFGGGESLLHADFLREFREICGNAWRLTVETSLNVRGEEFEKVLEVVDAFIVDIKDLNEGVYVNYTGKGNEQVLTNLQRLAEYVNEKQVRVRVPFIPNFNTKEHIRCSVETLREMGFRDIEEFSYIIRGDR